jgi:peptidoglycan/LPS O-acetylase OafA/YrhL
VSRSRVGNVDILRALAAMLVLGVHAYALGGRVAPIRAEHWYDVPLITLASGVWLFFAISGYVISRPFVDRLIGGEPLPRLIPYALRRVFRIYPLYWIAVTLVIAIDGSGGVTPWQLVSHYALLNNLVPGQQEAVFAPAWTLTLEVLFYAFVPLAAAALRRIYRDGLSAERLAVIVTASWLASIVWAAAADLPGDGRIGIWLRFLFPGMWQAFCPGILLAIAPHLRAPGWRRAVEFTRTRAAAMLAALCLIAAALLSADAPLRFGVVPYQLLVDVSRPLFSVGFGIVLAAALRASPWLSRQRWVLELGLASYGLYLLHPVIEAFMLAHGLAPVPHDTLIGYVVNLAVLTALTVPAAVASWYLLEQPALRLARWLGDGSRGWLREASP